MRFEGLLGTGGRRTNSRYGRREGQEQRQRTRAGRGPEMDTKRRVLITIPILPVGFGFLPRWQQGCQDPCGQNMPRAALASSDIFSGVHGGVSVISALT
jgi:hypothetical protein